MQKHFFTSREKETSLVLIFNKHHRTYEAQTNGVFIGDYSRKQLKKGVDIPLADGQIAHVKTLSVGGKLKYIAKVGEMYLFNSYLPELDEMNKRASFLTVVGAVSLLFTIIQFVILVNGDPADAGALNLLLLLFTGGVGVLFLMGPNMIKKKRKYGYYIIITSVYCLLALLDGLASVLTMTLSIGLLIRFIVGAYLITGIKSYKVMVLNKKLRGGHMSMELEKNLVID